LSARALVVLSNIFPLPKAEQRGLPFVPSSRLIHCQSIDLQAQRQSPSKLFFQFSVATSDRWARCIYKSISIAIYLLDRLCFILRNALDLAFLIFFLLPNSICLSILFS
jgi:hypothetical protein